MSIRLFVIAVALSLPVAAPAIARDSNSPDVMSGDPNEKICETITVTGSRLGKKKFCATRAEWQSMRMQDRQNVERSQQMPCTLTHNGPTGKPGC